MYRILGIEKLDYVNKNNKRVLATNLHCENLDPTNNVFEGQRVERIYCGQNVDCSGLILGDKVEIYYNKWGQVGTVAVM